MTDILNMLLYTRLRPGDLKRLNSNDIDMHRKKIDMIQHKTITNRNPSGIQIVIPISEKMADILMPRLAKTKPSFPLFPFRNMQKRWQRIRTLAGAPYIQMRDIRRTAASFLLDNGEDPLTVAQGLGHAGLDMLPTYTPRTMLHQKKSLDLSEKNF
jgi:integrase